MIYQLSEHADESDSKRLEMLNSELKEKTEEINKNYKSVCWYFNDNSYGEAYNRGGGEYTYKNKKENYETWGNDSDEEYDDEDY